jgi:hypothetical protein
MDTSSEYTFPVFISSTETNLKDLRAELASFLSETGYQPILSSAVGFPDSSPNLEPWESCIPVLDHSFVMILIIDGKYGTAMPWPNYERDMEGREVSPTHGEFLYSHSKYKRMFVFVRKELLTIYEVYKKSIETNGKEATRTSLKEILPNNVDFETLEFIEEIKNKKPISWITPFDDITDIKKEVKKKLLNQLSEIFLQKEHHIDSLIRTFDQVMNTSDKEEQKRILKRINATKHLMDLVDTVQSYESEIEKLNKKNAELKDDNEGERKESDKRIKELNDKILKLEKESLKSTDDNIYIKNGRIQIGNPNFIDQTALNKYGLAFTPSGSIIATGGRLSTLSGLDTPSSLLYASTITCAKCLKTQYPSLQTYSHIYGSSDFNKCSVCEKYYCSSCWPKGIQLASGIKNDKCPDCSKKI